MKLAKDNKTGIYYRPWFTDLEIIRGVYREYDISDFDKNDIVFDLGLNIGTFTYRIAPIVKQVISFEPDPINFRIAKLNTQQYKNVILYNAAIVGNNDKYRKLYKSDSNSEASHSLHKTKRNEHIEISCINYKEMISKYKPTIIKSDIEGEEYYLFNELLPKTIRIFIAEFHFGKKEWRKSYNEILNSLIYKQNFKGIYKNNSGKLWHTQVNLWRPT